MNDLEAIGIDKLDTVLVSILERCDDKNKDRMQYERAYIQEDTKLALRIIKALRDNNKNLKK